MPCLPQLNLRERYRRIPTTDLYFLNPLNHLRRQNYGRLRLPPLRNLGQNLYAVGRTGVIVRYGAAQDVHRLEKHGVRRIVYIVDDDIAAGAADPSLPPPYRAKLAAFAEEGWPALKTAADVVIVPGTVLAAAYGAKAHIMPPAWHQPPASTDHFARPHRIEVVHLGTGSHSADLALVAPAFAEILEALPDVRLTLLCGAAAPDALKGHPRVRTLRPMAWWRYKLALPQMRFHLALYPLQDSAFNRARSANKLYEHAIVGAASLMSSNLALREAAGPHNTQIFVEGGPQNWHGRIEQDLADVDRLRRRSETIAAHIRAADPLGEAARLWSEILASET
jgi:hypothetical protein